MAINTADGALYFKKSDSTVITAHDNTIMHIDSQNDRVGIGTTNPSSTFQVEGTGDYLANFKSSDATSGIKLTDSSSQSRVVNISGHLALVADANNNSSNSTIRFNIDTASVAASDSSMILTSTGLGIGTASPAFKLSVNSGTSDYPAHFESTDNKAAIIIADDDTTIYVSAESNRASLGMQPGLHVNNLNVMNTGYVGIGTSSPARRLTVEGASGDNLPARFIGGANTTHGSIEFQDPTTTADYKVVIGSKSDDLYFQSGGNEKARLTSGGFLGIGNSAPSAKLHVSGGDILIDNNNSLSFENVAGTQRDILTYNSSNKVRLDNPGGSTVDLNNDTLIVHRHGRIVTGKAGQSWTNGYSRNITIQNITDSTNNGFGVWNAFIGTNLRYDTVNNTFVRASDQSSSNWGNIAAQFFNGAAGNTDPAIDWVTDIPNESVSDASEVNVSGSTLVGLSKMTLTTGGSLGIGTRSPDGELHVLGTGGGNGDIYVERTSGAKIHLQAQSANGKIGTSSNHNLGLNTNGTTRVTIDTNGRVGIGTTSPADELHVDGSGDTSVRITTTSTTAEPKLVFVDGSGDYSSLEKVNRDIKIKAFNTDVAYFTNSGRVGIGTSSPDANLDIESDLPTIRLTETDDSTYSEISQSFGYLTINNDAGNSGSGDAIIFKVDNSEKVRFESGGSVLIGNATNFSDASADDLQVGNTTGAHGISIMSNNSHNGNLFFGDNDNNDAGRIAYNHTNNRMEFYTNRSQRMVITSAGNVGIGTNAAAQKLDVRDGDITTRDSTNTNYAQLSRYVGLILKGNGTGTRSIKTPNTDALTLGTNDTERVRITSGGNVGIGTSSPSATLEVSHDNNSTVDIMRLRNGDSLYSQSFLFQLDTSKDMVITGGSSSGGIKFVPGTRGVTVSNKLVVGDTFSIREDGTNDEIKSTGNVLYVKATEYSFQDNSSNERISINSSGAIEFNNAYTFPTSIGSAGQVLKVPSSGTQLIWAADAGGGSATVLTDTDGDTKIQVEESADEDIIRFDTAGTQRMVITDAGRVGINTQSPAAMLHVNGGIVAVGDGTNTTYYEEDKIHSYATSGFIIDGREGITLETTSDDKDITFKINDSVNGLQTYMTVDGGEGRVVFNKWTRHVDNARILVGTGGDLSLYHDGTHSFVSNTQGSLYIRSSNTVQIENSSGNDMITAQSGGAVTLFHNASSKLATKSDGVDITGELQSDSLDVDGNADISGNLALGGNLTVNGTTTTINTATLDVEDKNITLNYGSGDTSSSANGAGITIQDAVNSTTDATILWDASNDEFDFSHPIKVAGSLGVTNIVTNKVVKFNGSILDDSNIADDGSTITLGSNTVVNGATDFNGGVSVNVDSSSTSLGNHQAALRIDNTNTTTNNWAALVFDSNNGSSAEVSARFTDHANNYADLYFANRGSGGYTTKMLISQDGSVGVGTTTPKAKLHVSGGGYFTGFNNPNGSGVSGLEIGYDGSKSVLQSYDRANGAYKAININASSASFTQGGVGIGLGTTAPSYKLHVKETGVNGGAIYVEDGTSWLRVIPNLGGSGFNPMSVAGDIGLIFSNDNDSTTASSSLGLLIAPHSTSAGGIKILEDGRVGIGTTTPNSRFTVNTTTTGDGIELQSSEVSIAKLSRSVVGSTVVASLDGVSGRPIHIGGVVNEDVILGNAGGNVGIGTAVPTDKLHVIGNINIVSNKIYNGASNNSAGLELGGNRVNLHGYSGIRFYSSAAGIGSQTERMRIEDDGKVGIGVTSPGRKLSVGGAIELTTADTTVHSNHAAIRRGSAGEMFLDAPGDIHVNLDTNNNNTDRAFRIRTNATTTDLFTVNESGNATLSGNLETTSYLSSSAGAYFNTNTGSNPVYITRQGNTNESLKIYTDDAGAIFESIQDESSDNYGNFIFAMDSGVTEPYFDIRKGTASSGTKFRVDGSGNVGINEADPDSRLHITGTDGGWDKHITIEHNSSDIGKILVDTDGIKFRNMSSGNGFYFRDNSNATQMIIDSTGQVGIGVGSNPGQTLDVGGIIRSSATNPQVRIHTSSGTGTGYLVYGDSTDDDVGQIYYSHANNEMGFIVNGGSAKMLINSSGNVGVGDGFGTPQSTLHVQSPSADGSGIRISRTGSSGYMQLYPAYSGIPTIMSNNAGLHLGYASNTAGIRIHTGNKVGVNQTAPKASFQVEEYGIDTSSTSTSATTQVTIHSFPIADFRTARFTIQITNTTDSTYHSTEIIAVHDGTTANITEFGEVHTGSSVEATFDADISSNNFRLRATPTSTNSMIFKVVCHSITI